MSENRLKGAKEHLKPAYFSSSPSSVFIAFRKKTEKQYLVKKRNARLVSLCAESFSTRRWSI